MTKNDKVTLVTEYDVLANEIEENEVRGTELRKQAKDCEARNVEVKARMAEIAKQMVQAHGTEAFIFKGLKRKPVEKKNRSGGVSFYITSPRSVQELEVLDAGE